MTGSEVASILTVGSSSAATYLSHCPSLSPDLAQLAEDSDHRPLLRAERTALEAAVWACAAAVRLARPALVHAQIEGRLYGE